MKAFADDKINVTEKLELVLERVENCGKRRKCWLLRKFGIVWKMVYL